MNEDDISECDRSFAGQEVSHELSLEKLKQYISPKPNQNNTQEKTLWLSSFGIPSGRWDPLAFQLRHPLWQVGSCGPVTAQSHFCQPLRFHLSWFGVTWPVKRHLKSSLPSFLSSKAILKRPQPMTVRKNCEKLAHAQQCASFLLETMLLFKKGTFCD